METLRWREHDEPDRCRGGVWGASVAMTIRSPPIVAKTAARNLRKYTLKYWTHVEVAAMRNVS